MTSISKGLLIAGLSLGAALTGSGASASSHMDAPLITLDDAANTTDVYAFRSQNGDVPYLTTAVSVYPFEEPGIGPNRYNFDDDVRYAIHVSLGDDVRNGVPTITYEFHFNTKNKNEATILQSYLGVIKRVNDEAQNLTQFYSVTRVDHRTNKRRYLGRGIVPPNNQGLVTPFYNQGNNGDNPAKDGVSTFDALDRYTQRSIHNLRDGHRGFAGQRDDGFFADIQSIFDLDLTFGGPNKPFDSQGGFNVHTIVLDIPLSALGGDQQVVGVYATTSRRQVTVLSSNPERRDDSKFGRYVQVARQGNPLFNEGFVAIADKDLYSRTSPSRDEALFSIYALEPELAQILVPLLDLPEDLLTNRTDLKGIFIPDVIKVDLSTGPARLAGSGEAHPTNPDDDDFSSLSVFGGDALTSAVQAGLPGFPPGTIPGGWPNGRRFGDDVVDIAVSAAVSDLRFDPLVIRTGTDRVDANDIGYNKVFPYAATPLNGRNHVHH